MSGTYDNLPEGVYSTNFSFVPLIKAAVASLSDSTATVITTFSRSLADPAGGLIPDDAKVESYQNFVLAMNLLYQYTQEFLDSELSDKLDMWLESVKIEYGLDIESIQTGISLSEEFQNEMFVLGLKDTSQKIEMFDFELYREITGANKMKNGLSDIMLQDLNFDPIDPDIEIIGFSGRSEFSAMYTNFSNRSFYLLSEGRIDDERTFFYSVLPGFSPAFDIVFLDNCISIKNRILNETDKTGNVLKITKRDYHNVYLLQKAEFSRLMMRAGIHQQPDIIDNKQPDYVPASKPAGL